MWRDQTRSGSCGPGWAPWGRHIWPPSWSASLHSWSCLVCAPSPPAFRERLYCSSVGCWRAGYSTWGIAALLWSATCQADCRKFSLPNGQLLLDHAGTVGTAAVALLLIGFSQTAGDARAFAAKQGYQIDLNQESVAQALANTGS